MMYYAFKSAILLTLLFGGFSVLLSRETFHRFNRGLLLSIVLTSLILPVVHITTSQPLPFAIEQYWNMQESSDDSASSEVNIGLSEMADVIIDEDKKTLNQSESNESIISEPTDMTNVPNTMSIKYNPLTDKDFWNALYIIGFFIAAIRFILRSVRLGLSLRGGMRSHDKQGNTIIVKGGDFPPFSFMHQIVISVKDYEHHRQSILTHEKAHARLGHSWDILLIELVQVVQWFNPFAWLLASELKAVHEYEADEAVISQGIDAKKYQQLLVIKAVGNRLQLFANTLNRGSLKKRINMMQQKKSSQWRMFRAAFAIPVAAMTVLAFATPETIVETPPQSVAKSENSKNDGMLLVEYKTHQKFGKGFRDYYLIHLPQGVWVETNGASHIEEQCFNYSFDNTQNEKVNNSVVMMLNGVPFDHDHLPKLSSSELKKIEIKLGENNAVDINFPTKALNIKGRQTKVNLITTPVNIPAGIEGNVPRVQTLLLPGNGELYIKNGKATPGDWMHCSITEWEPTSYGYSVRNEFERSKTKPGFKCWIYSSKETTERDISRAEALMSELSITNYEIVRNLPKRHFTDSELRQWAQTEKAKGTAFSRLYDAMAPNHMDCADVRRQWHIVKAVYGIQANEQTAEQNDQQEERVYDICEQLPQFPGGEMKMMEFIAKNIKYPQEATEFGVQGRVKVQFIVEKDGSLTNLKIVESSQDESEAKMKVINANANEKERQDANDHNAGVQALRDEAIRMVSSMPKWNPGKQQGKVVRVKFFIPVTYRLN